jgi:hypothetical protein
VAKAKTVDAPTLERADPPGEDLVLGKGLSHWLRGRSRLPPPGRSEMRSFLKELVESPADLVTGIHYIGNVKGFDFYHIETMRYTFAVGTNGDRALLYDMRLKPTVDGEYGNRYVIELHSTLTIMDDATAYQTVAAEQGLAVAEVQQAIDAFKAAKVELGTRTVTAREKGMTREQVRVEKDKLRLEGLQLEYKQRLETVVLPEGRLENRDQYLAAARLASTFQQIQKLQSKLGLEITEKDARVRKAESMRVIYERAQRKIKAAPARRARLPNRASKPSPR